MISGVGLPYAYDHFTPTTSNPMPAPPFICFMLTGSADAYADDINYVSVETLSIELYAATKNYSDEAAVEEALLESGLAWEKEETYLGDEKLYMTTWETEVVIEKGETNVQ